MHLSRLEIQGFKTFAKKTVVEFTAPSKNRHALTVIVGPNGSGKSNLSDAIRWCLGEQSMKMLRGKRSEDIIFSGSKGKARAGFAEVTMTLNNEDGAMGIEYAEVVITRRMFRDGEANYLLNGKQARLADIQLLLAEAGVGQRSYSVVGQGMVDHVLTSSPEERKIFFDDATGVRGLQIKRHQAMLKLKKSSETLVEVELLLGEIEPRLRMLKRMVRRLEQREQIESELRKIQLSYYGTVWFKMQDDKIIIDQKILTLNDQIKTKQLELKKGDDELLAMEKAVSAGKEDSGEMQKAQTEYRQAQSKLGDVRRSLFEAERELELAKVKAQSTWTPLPLPEIIKALDEMLGLDESVGFVKLFTLARNLKNKLTKPNPDDFKPDPKMVKAVSDAKAEIKIAEDNIQKSENYIDEINKKASSSKSEVFVYQRKLREVQGELHKLEQRENELKIELARVETRIEDLSREMHEELGNIFGEAIKQAPENKLHDLDDARVRMLRLKNQLELIGGIDQETVDEYNETNERFTFLDGQLKDIREAIKSTEKVVDELDQQIQVQSEKAFKEINKEFQKYFKILFGGGSCSLVKMKGSDENVKDEDSNETRVALDRPMEELAEEKIEEDLDSATAILNRFKKRRDSVTGIEITATPPGKRLKALNLLSGGERALTSIALLSAIMATNPAPFVVLDEVDAALDESNTVRFANILDELRKLSQFIVVTHNRATMERADLMYGVTMGDDGVSNLLSVTLSDVTKNGTARR
ncbi:MAG: AAA family ATPase [Candidatus Uhrbacteria bacterium]|nr:AAA family ATPase [Candidatus Uhrbacteria bacterium]